MESSLLEAAAQKKFLKKLHAWYTRHGRHDMRWRQTKDPYAILVSEFMLQQTTVETVKPYYERFMKKFPTVRSLANGDLNEVLALWSGLGYYARARNLWAAARVIENDWGGKISPDPAILETLPGVGAYTAGAIAAFAFNRPAAVLDGNIIRVFMRLLALDDDPKLKAIQTVLKKIALDLNHQSTLQKKSASRNSSGPRNLNLALMDLGATMCLPQDPHCGKCPAAEFCLAKRYDRQNDIPLRGDKFERATIRRIHAVIGKKIWWLMAQRPKEGLFGGLWEFPGVDIPVGVEPVPFLEKQFLDEFNLKIQVVQALPMFQHQLSHRIFMVRSFLCDLAAPSQARRLPKSPIYDRFRWVSLKTISRLGISAVTKQIINNILHRSAV